MNHLPLFYAGAAVAYIATIASFMFYAPRWASGEDTVVVPIAMLSLLVLSAAVMGFLFLSRPIMLYMDGKKDEAISFFGRTVAIFAIITAIFFIVIFLLPTLL